MKRILVTAFEPFGGSARNSSLDTLRSLPERIADAEIVKLSHHGSATSNTDAWLAAASPEVCLLSGESPDRAALWQDGRRRRARVRVGEGVRPAVLLRARACACARQCARRHQISPSHLSSLLRMRA